MIGLIINTVVIVTTTEIYGILFLLGLFIDLFAIPLLILLYVIIGDATWFSDMIRDWLVNNFLVDSLFYLAFGVITYRLSANIANKMFSEYSLMKSCKIFGTTIYKTLKSIIDKTKT